MQQQQADGGTMEVLARLGCVQAPQPMPLPGQAQLASTATASFQTLTNQACVSLHAMFLPLIVPTSGFGSHVSVPHRES